MFFRACFFPVGIAWAASIIPFSDWHSSHLATRHTDSGQARNPYHATRNTHLAAQYFMLAPLAPLNRVYPVKFTLVTVEPISPGFTLYVEAKRRSRYRGTKAKHKFTSLRLVYSLLEDLVLRGRKYRTRCPFEPCIRMEFNWEKAYSNRI